MTTSTNQRVSGGRWRNCQQCGKSFRYRPSQLQRCCSRACAATWKLENNPRRAACVVCGDRITCKMGRYQRTCSAKCGYALLKSKARRQKPCKHCGLLFWPVRQPTGLYETWCSRACYDAARSERRWVRVACEQCGIGLVRERRTRSKVAYCSKECQHKHLVGPAHPLFRGDADPNRGRGWKRLAKQIRLRDNNTCLRCGSTQAEHARLMPVDHIKPWRLFENKDEANDPSNLATLCPKCHGYKTSYAERRYLLGDVMAYEQFKASLTLPSAVFARFSERE